MSNLGNAWKYFSIIWSVVAFIAVAAFFFGGQWQDWNKIEEDYKSGAFASGNTTDLLKRIAELERFTQEQAAQLDTVQEANYLPSGGLITAVRDAGFVQYGDKLYVLNEFNYPNDALRADVGNGAVGHGSLGEPKYIAGNEWYLGKSN